MREIYLDAAGWQTPDDVYRALLHALEAPDWHGHNLDALWDSIVGGGINGVDAPFTIFVRNLSGSGACRTLLNQIAELFREACFEGRPAVIQFD